MTSRASRMLACARLFNLVQIAREFASLQFCYRDVVHRWLSIETYLTFKRWLFGNGGVQLTLS